MRLIVSGAVGMVGAGARRDALDAPEVESVLVFDASGRMRTGA